MKRGLDLLNDPFLNKGTAFTAEERAKYNLVGLLPPHIQTIEEQVRQAYENYSTKADSEAKRHYLMRLFSKNRTLFYNLFSKHLEEFMPVVYDPTIAPDIEKYSERYVDSQYACFLSADHPESIEASLVNAAAGRDIDLIVVTDAEAILGIGDWGTNGVEISVGKLMVYTAAAGLDPSRVLPVVIDAGTHRQELLDSDLYLGERHGRFDDEKYYEFVDRFVTCAEQLFPNLYLHFEDFGRSHATVLLDKYKNTYPVFNDDVQGTGIVTLAGILGGLNITGEKLADQIYLCFGAGTAGCGIANRILQEFVDQGVDREEARTHFYLVDRQGLLFDDMNSLTPEQRPFARKRSEFEDDADLTTLLDVVRAVHPTIMVGTSTVHGAFTEDVVREMAALCKRPMIFPLSNPTKLAEATAFNVLTWTEGRALVATGVPSDDVTVNGVTYQIGQANNALIYPGLGLGVLASKARLLTDQMISLAAHSLGGIVDTTQPGAAVLPPVSRITEFSERIATGVAKEAVKQGLNRKPITDASAAVHNLKWVPVYQELEVHLLS
ncbi:malolactic enzyme [Lancefieldella sp. Marseille-Q7238]|uniref:malolactic enzyme n=1 Tax=Lancefieldella sp. Marseille-Q7238 TaxID=3022127 RepID=UPI0024A969ED|nr:malolactic enzyme [Lancefieldella sp. Marseille-Q7238]